MRAHGHRVSRRAREEPHPLRLDAPRADRRARRRRLRARVRQARRAADASRPRPDQRGHRRRQRGARFDSDGGDRRRRASRTTTAAIRTRRSTSTRTPTSSRSTGRSASASTASIASRICRAIMERAFHLAQTGRPGPGARRRADGHLLGRPADRRVPAGAGDDGAPDHRRGDRRSGSSTRWRRPSARCSTPAAACCRRARPPSWRRSPKRSRCRSRTR